MKSIKQNAKQTAGLIRENLWISLCVIALGIAAFVTAFCALPPSPAPEAETEVTAPPAEASASIPETPPSTTPAPETPAPSPAPETAEPPAATSLPAATPTPAITPPANSGSPVSGSDIVLSPVPLPRDIELN